MKNKPERLGMYLLMMAATLAVMLILGEVVLRFFSPVEYLSPRYQYSPKYGFLVFQDTRMEHCVPGRYKFYYTVNEDGYRGRRTELRAEYDVPNIVVLGDSYSFGMGVDDGDEYAAILGDRLAGSYNVVNLSNPGWGLTQQIRRYYDLGSLYRPDLVVLQYCSNDPEDNFTNRVTRIENGEFVFVDSDGNINWIKKYMSRSFVQKSQLYNFVRGRLYLLASGASLRAREGAFADERKTGDDASPRGLLHVSLLEKFAEDLHRQGVVLVMIAVNGQLERYPCINDAVHALDTRGFLRYIEVEPWFDGVKDFVSPEGHLWGQKAHYIIGNALADSLSGMTN